MARQLVPLRTERTGRVTLAAPLTRHHPVSDLLVGLAIIGAILVVVGWVAGDGLRVSPRPGCFDGDCSGDAPRGDQP